MDGQKSTLACNMLKVVALVVVIAPFYACHGGRNVAAQTARHLHSDIVAYEVMLNDRIAHEKGMYDERLAMIREEQRDLLMESLEQFRRHRSAELASAMSADPEREVRIGNVIHFLNETVQSEYGLYRRLQERELLAAAEIQGALDKMDQHRERLAQMEEQVAGLATRSKLRTNNKLLMSSVDELLDQLESDQRNQEAARRKAKKPHPSRLGFRAHANSATSSSSVVPTN